MSISRFDIELIENMGRMEWVRVPDRDGQFCYACEVEDLIKHIRYLERKIELYGVK